jgi:5'-3' exonuclease
MALLIDADILAYEAVSGAQQEVELDTDVWQIYCDLKEARKLFNNSIDKLMTDTTQEDYILCFSDPERVNFRKQLNPGVYKANRSGRKPVGYWPFVHKIMKRRNVQSWPRLEADDVIGIMATRDEGKHVIWSIDKDLKQIPGRHLVDGIEEVQDEDDADYWFYRQVLTGDAVDNYPGCKGIGPVKADKALKGQEDRWSAVLNQYIAAGHTEADALLNARMAFILRHGNYNIEKGTIRLWKPTPVAD